MAPDLSLPALRGCATVRKPCDRDYLDKKSVEKGQASNDGNCQLLEICRCIAISLFVVHHEREP